MNVLIDPTHPFNANNAAAGYYASLDPAKSLTASSGTRFIWDNTDSVLLATDSSGNTTRYVIQRMCRTAGVAVKDASCLFSGAAQDNNKQNIPLPQEICKGDGLPRRRPDPHDPHHLPDHGPEKYPQLRAGVRLLEGAAMKPDPKNRATSRVLLLSLALIAAEPGAAAAGAGPAVELATSPMATSTTTVVKPNLMFVLDDSGSMDWDYLPDTAKNFAGKYGYNTSQCNGNYYNPAITYDPPVNSAGAPLNATATTFTAAYKDGYDTGAGTINLSTGFTGGSGSGASGISLTAGPGFLLHLHRQPDQQRAEELFQHQQHLLPGMQQRHRIDAGQRRVHQDPAGDDRRPPPSPITAARRRRRHFHDHQCQRLEPRRSRQPRREHWPGEGDHGRQARTPSDQHQRRSLPQDRSQNQRLHGSHYRQLRGEPATAPPSSRRGQRHHFRAGCRQPRP